MPNPNDTNRQGANPPLMAEYLFQSQVFGSGFVASTAAVQLAKAFLKFLSDKKVLDKYRNSTQELGEEPEEQFRLIGQWITAFLQQDRSLEFKKEVISEAAILLLTDQLEDVAVLDHATGKTLSDLHGDHSLTRDGQYHLDYHAFTQKMERYFRESVPAFQNFHQDKQRLTEQYRKHLRLEEFQAKVLSSFVRNQLIDQVYLPLIGDNLAKQIGTAGEDTRTDRMGMLLLISPPGYGKTTLMEYIANRLGLIFMKINGPSIGHQVVAFDPAEAPNRTAARELEKLNLAFEMGDNVMIYLDDIQHCHPEFLQRFISLCDAQRRVEGVWKGESKTYDLRSKRVAVVMAGNPYTESGDKFKIPDMLANRSDIYNLGDIIGESEGVFKMSYLENALTSNAILARLAAKHSDDIYILIEAAEQGQQGSLDLKGNHAPEELSEYLAVLEKLIQIREVVLKVNQTYIQSAATHQDYRTEPAFKLQGSYRNMKKMAEKVAPMMNDAELQTLILSHYEGEVQTLTADAEANFLKLKELMNIQTSAESERWESIKTTFRKNNRLRGQDGQDPLVQLNAQIDQVADHLARIGQVLERKA